jgi:hypothetical protein
MVASLGKALGADPSAITKGLGVAGPLLLQGMSKMADTTGGTESLMKMLPQDSSGPLGSLGSILSGLMGGGAAADAIGGSSVASSLLGPGASAIGGSLSRALGFNVTPLLAMAAPALLGSVAKMMKSDNVDAEGMAQMLKTQSAAFKADPANRETMALMSSATAAGDTAQAMMSAYGADWSKVAGGPVAAMMMVATADLSGLLGSIQEVQAASKALLAAATRAAPGSVLASALGGGLNAEMLKDVKALAPRKEKLIEVVKAGVAAVAARSPGDVRAYKDAILSVAKATAEAAKDGGFLGIGGTRVSKDEQASLDAIAAALA